MKKTLLVVDDDVEIAEAHAGILRQLGFRSVVQTDSSLVIAQLTKGLKVDLVLLDMRMPKLSGLELLRRIKVTQPQLPVIIVTVVDDIEKAVEATKSGAYSYLLKPLRSDQLKRVLESYFSTRLQSATDDPRFGAIVTQNLAFQNIFHRVAAFAGADVPILIEGETGTGKELIAELIHSLSGRALAPFVAINIAALSAPLFEAELFGHSKNAFTGAQVERWGYLKKAKAGSLFLDEIGELDLSLQAKLLRLLQTNVYQRLGETKDQRFEARFIFATNRSLKTEAEQGRFRPDLYYRLASYTIKLPPLRERGADIELLANYFLKKHCAQFGRVMEGIQPDVIALLNKYPFPGNVRELEGLIGSAILLEPSNFLSPESFPHHIRFAKPKGRDLASSRYHEVMRALGEVGGNQTKAAEKLGIARGTLSRYLKEYRKKGYRV